MNKEVLNIVWGKLRKGFFKFANKYTISILLFLVWVLYLSNDNLYDDYKYKKEISRMESEIELYKKDIEQSKMKQMELRSNKDNLEKFAREQYNMKQNNEDIFIVK